MVKIVLDFTIQDNQIIMGPVQKKELEPLEFGEVHVTGGGSSINVSGAEPGQMIIVKTVDTNGKPTAWEAIDRTHGDGAPGDVIMAKTNLEDNPENSFDNGEGCWFFNLPEEIVAGKTYTVTVNGVTYAVTAVTETSGWPADGCVLVEVPDAFQMYYHPAGLVYYAPDYNAAFWLIGDLPTNPDSGMTAKYPVTLRIQEASGEVKKLDVKYLDINAIKAKLPTIEMVATFDDGSTKTFKLYGEAVTE